MPGKILTDEEKRQKALEKRKNVLKELIDTEETYVNSLKHLNDKSGLIKKFLKKKKPKNLDPQSKEMLSNYLDLISEIVVMNTAILNNLQDLLKYQDNKERLPETFKKLSTCFYDSSRLYGEAITQYNDIADELKNEKVTKVLTELNKKIFPQKSNNSTLGINDYMIMPVQRFPRYKLLFEQLKAADDIRKEAKKTNQGTLESTLKVIMETTKNVNEHTRAQPFLRLADTNPIFETGEPIVVETQITKDFDLKRIPDNMLTPKSTILFSDDKNGLYIKTDAPNTIELTINKSNNNLSTTINANKIELGDLTFISDLLHFIGEKHSISSEDKNVEKALNIAFSSKITFGNIKIEPIVSGVGLIDQGKNIQSPVSSDFSSSLSDNSMTLSSQSSPISSANTSPRQSANKGLTPPPKPSTPPPPPKFKKIERKENTKSATQATKPSEMTQKPSNPAAENQAKKSKLFIPHSKQNQQTSQKTAITNPKGHQLEPKQSTMKGPDTNKLSSAKNTKPKSNDAGLNQAIFEQQLNQQLKQRPNENKSAPPTRRSFFSKKHKGG